MLVEHEQIAPLECAITTTYREQHGFDALRVSPSVLRDASHVLLAELSKQVGEHIDLPVLRFAQITTREEDCHLEWVVRFITRPGLFPSPQLYLRAQNWKLRLW